MPEGWTSWMKQRLIANGTYNADGTVNMETAERAGWAQAWREQEEKMKAESEANAAPSRPEPVGRRRPSLTTVCPDRPGAAALAAALFSSRPAGTPSLRFDFRQPVD